MAKVIFMELVDSVRGKYCRSKSDSPIFQKRKTCNTVYHIHNPFAGAASAAQVAAKTKFTNVTAQVKAIMADDEQVATYKANFAKQTKYSTLRGFIFAQLYAEPEL